MIYAEKLCMILLCDGFVMTKESVTFIREEMISLKFSIFSCFIRKCFAGSIIVNFYA